MNNKYKTNGGESKNQINQIIIKNVENLEIRLLINLSSDGIDEVNQEEKQKLGIPQLINIAKWIQKVLNYFISCFN